MYATCLFCNGDLGRNEVVEAFPVGRRLAFDGERGRLWVVCRRCERWNLSPLDERWEAIEQCERLYRDTRLRVSTDNIGLARLRSGAELVRVGRALRPEFAAWRYGDQFGRRRKRQLIVAGAGIALVGGVVAGGMAAGIGVVSFAGLVQTVARSIVHGSPDKVVARVPTADGLLKVRRKHLARTAILHSDRGPFALQVRTKRRAVLIDGEHAVRAAGLLLPAANRFGGAPADVQHAVGRIEAAGHPESYLAAVARAAAPTRAESKAKSWWTGEPATGLLALDRVDRLAIEMALQEDAERRAMEGELSELERAWREAEEIAAIADDLLVPAAVRGRLEALKRGRG